MVDVAKLRQMTTVANRKRKLAAQNRKPVPGVDPHKESRKEIRKELKELGRRLAMMARGGYRKLMILFEEVHFFGEWTDANKESCPAHPDPRKHFSKKMKAMYRYCKRNKIKVEVTHSHSWDEESNHCHLELTAKW